MRAGRNDVARSSWPLSDQECLERRQTNFQQRLRQCRRRSRPLAQVQIIVFGGQEFRINRPRWRAPSPGSAGKIVSGLVLVAAQEIHQASAHAHQQKPKTPRRNPGSFALSRRLEASSPVRPGNRPISFWLAGKARPHGNCRFFRVPPLLPVLAENVMHGIEIDRLPFFKPNGTKGDSVDRPCGTLFFP